MHKWERMWDAHQPVLGQQSLCEESLDSLSRISRKIDFFVRECHPKPTIPCKTRVLLDAQKAQDHLLRCKYT